LTSTNPLFHLCDGGFVDVTGLYALEYYSNNMPECVLSIGFFLVNSQRFISSVFNDEFVNRIGSNRLYLLSFRSVVEQKYKIEELALKNPQ
jgi:hypothetical protein